MDKNNFIKPDRLDYIDPVTYYNTYKIDDAINIFNAHHKRTAKLPALFIENGKTKNDEVVVMDGVFIVGSHERLTIPKNCTLTPFQVFNILSHKKNYHAAIAEIDYKQRGRDIPFIRVGVNYFKVIRKPDRNNIIRTELKTWNKQEITEDYGKSFISMLSKYDDFTIEPDHVNYRKEIRSGDFLYRNLYSPFEHTPKEGDFPWTYKLLRHIFDDQYELGLRYLQCLYLYPRQILPILVLVSKERSTGKTTFINWLSQIFGANMVIINPSDLTNDFNSSYSKANIIAIEETLIEKQSAIEKLKAITTSKYMSVNEKHISHYKIPFFGKVIINSNNEDTFARIDDEEIRFWVRKINVIEITNARIEEDLVKEIPAFLHHLTTLPEPDFTKSRMVFTPEEIATDQLKKVKQESKPTLYKELIIRIQEYFDGNETATELKMTLSDIKDFWFDKYHNINRPYIRQILKDHFGLTTEKPQRYISLTGESKTGTCFTFNKIDFCDINTSEIDTKNDDFTLKQDDSKLPF